MLGVDNILDKLMTFNFVFLQNSSYGFILQDVLCIGNFDDKKTWEEIISFLPFKVCLTKSVAINTVVYFSMSALIIDKMKTRQ